MLNVLCYSITNKYTKEVQQWNKHKTGRTMLKCFFSNPNINFAGDTSKEHPLKATEQFCKRLHSIQNVHSTRNID